MLKIAHYIKPSDINGTGLFAKQFIPAGTIIWEFTPGFDIEVSKAQFNRVLTPLQKNWVENYASYDADTRTYCIVCDFTKFMNHSVEGENVRNHNRGTQMIAIKDIKIGQEILMNYELDCPGSANFNKDKNEFLEV